MTSVSWPRWRNSASSGVPMKQLCTRFSTTASPSIGVTAGLKSLPGCPGRSEELDDAGLHFGIVAAAPARRVESVLDVDDQQRCVPRDRLHECRACAGL